MNCDTNIVTVSACDDVFVSNVVYDIETEILTVTLSDDTVYTTTIPTSAVLISAQADNQIVELMDGLYVALPSFGVNSLDYDNGNNLLITSSDASLTVDVQKVGTEITVDITCPDCGSSVDDHLPLTVNSSVAFSFDDANQILNLPLPTLVQDLVDSNIYTYTANDGSGDIYTLTFHPELTVIPNQPYSFDVDTQILNLPLPVLVDNGDGTYTYDPGDGGLSFIISVGGSLEVNFGVPQLFNAGTQVLDLPTPTLTDNGDYTYTYDPGDGVSSTILIGEYPLGTTNLTSDKIVDAITELSGINRAWSAEGLLQTTNDIDVNLTDDIYHTGAVGIGLDDSETIQGQHEVKGDTYVSTDGSEVNKNTQLDRDGLPITIIERFVQILAGYQIELKDASHVLQIIDNNGNFALGEIAALFSLPEDMYGAEKTFSMSNFDNSPPPSAPISVNTVTEFILNL